MPDMAMCRDSSCPSRGTCYRYIAVPSPFRQTYASFDRGTAAKCTRCIPVDASDKLRTVEEVDAEAARKEPHAKT